MQSKKIILTGKPARIYGHTYMVSSTPVLRQLPAFRKEVHAFVDSENFVTAISVTAAALCIIAHDDGHQIAAIALATIFAIGLVITMIEAVKTFKQ